MIIQNDRFRFSVIAVLNASEKKLQVSLSEKEVMKLYFDMSFTLVRILYVLTSSEAIF